MNKQENKHVITDTANFFFFGHLFGIWKFPGQGSNPSQSFYLRHDCSNASSLTHCTRPGIEQNLHIDKLDH